MAAKKKAEPAARQKKPPASLEGTGSASAAEPGKRPRAPVVSRVNRSRSSGRGGRGR